MRTTASAEDDESAVVLANELMQNISSNNRPVRYFSTSLRADPVALDLTP
jgi:hypothetical protein